MPRDNDRPLYRVQFENTWEPIANLGNCRELLQQYDPHLSTIPQFEIEPSESIEWIVNDIVDTRYDQNNNVIAHS